MTPPRFVQNEQGFQVSSNETLPQWQRPRIRIVRSFAAVAILRRFAAARSRLSFN
jgi:hypothetical protein